MISELEISNFRSIRKDKISLEPLTVLIGANGSGKSNLVKALEFISEIPFFGSQAAINRQGGREGLVSKEIPLKEIKNNPVKIKYKLELPPPNPDIEHPESISVSHEFELSFLNNKKCKILKESLQFNKVLYVGEVLSHKKRRPDLKLNSYAHHDKKSYVKISQIDGTPDYKFYPKVNKKNIKTFVNWLGFESLEKKISTPEELDDFLKSFKRGRSRRLMGKTKSDNKSQNLFIDPEVSTIVDYAPQAHYFLSCISSIQRYDLLLHELRREQAPSDSLKISKVGENLPSAISKLSSKSNSYKRLRTSFEAIAPHILNIKSSPLRTGKEFIEFLESRNGRGIESWESSDGSLRALAILVALETAKKGDTLIIEEPEQNLHPWAIRILIDHVRQVVDEGNIQIIITTHSEHVLAGVKSEEVRVVSRSLKRGGTKFKRIDQIIKGKEIKMGDIGRLWVKGMLGGVPSE